MISTKNTPYRATLVSRPTTPTPARPGLPRRRRSLPRRSRRRPPRSTLSLRLDVDHLAGQRDREQWAATAGRGGALDTARRVGPGLARGEVLLPARDSVIAPPQQPF